MRAFAQVAVRALSDQRCITPMSTRLGTKAARRFASGMVVGEASMPPGYVLGLLAR
jgi:hypothetical protein